MPPPEHHVLLSVDDAIKQIGKTIQPYTKSETISVKQSSGRILAEESLARRDIPAFDNSAMDGYLFLTQDLENGLRKFPVAGEIRPEHEKPDGIAQKTCKQIMTGAPVPQGHYTVVPVEMTREQGTEVDVLEIPKQNPIRRQGEGYRKGTSVLPKGVMIRPYEMGLMIESGNRECRVLKKIRVALQITGSEIDEDMNSNGPVLEGLIRHWPGVSVSQWPVVDDESGLVLQRLKELKESADVVLTTGGISMGKHDYIPGAMGKLGAEFIVRKVQQKPGKPFTVTKLENTLFFHLPGNPVSAVFTAEYYVRKALNKMLGFDHEDSTAIAAVPLKNPRPDKTLFVLGKLGYDDQGRLAVAGEGVMKSHLLQLYRNSDVYIRLDPETEYSKGDNVPVTPYSTTWLP